MASKRIKGIIVEIGGDTSPLGKALKEVDEQSKKTQSELKEINRGLKEAPESTVLWKQKQELLTKAIEESKDKLKILQSAQEEMNRKYEAGEIGEETYRNFQREVEKAKSETKKLSGELSDTNNKLGELSSKSEDAGKKLDDMGDDAKEAGKEVDDAGDKTEDFGDKLDKTAAVAVAAGAAIAGAAKAAYDAWSEVDEGYDTIITKTGATGKALEEMRAVADNVFSTLPVEMSDVGTAVGEINTRFNSVGKELEHLTGHFLKYANVNSTDVNSSIDNVSASMKAFETDVSETTDVLDTLTSVGQKTGIDLSVLEGLLVTNSATFKEMGLSIYESAQLLGQFEINGVDTATALAGLKKAQQNATAEGKTLNEALAENITAIKNSKTDTEALQIATDLFGKKGAAAMAQAIRENRFALEDLSGNMSAFSGTVENTFEATQDAPDKLQISLNKLKLEGAELADKVLPKIADGAEDFNDYLPELLDYAKKALPLIKGIGTGFISWKALSGIGAGISKAKELTDILKNTSNFAGLASSGILGIAGALAIGVGSYVYSANKAKEEKLDKIFEEVTEASDLCAESIKENSDKMSELKESAREAADSELALTDNTENLWKELQLLVDENGKVKEGYEDRVAFISNELTEATGEEIALIDGQIQKYDDLKAKIGEVIERQRAEILQRSYSSAYEEAISQNSSTAKDIVAARSRIDEQSAFISQMYGNARKDFESVGMLSDFTKLGNLSLSNLDSWKDVFSDEELAQLRGAFTAIEQERANISGYQQQYSDNTYIISQYEKAQEAMLAGNYNNAQIAFSAIDDLEYASLQDSKKNLDEKLDAIDDMVDESVRVYKEGVAIGDKYARDTFSGTIATIIQQATEGGISAGELLESGIVTELSKIDGFDATMLLEFANALGVDFGTVFGYVSADKASSIMTQYLYSVNDLIPQNINSQSDYELYKQGKYAVGIPMMADGGFLHNGAAVVSEAGPELLEIINGGARVTPLTGSAKNTAVNGMGPRNVTVNQYIHVNELKNSYDTRRMAQDLSAETRRVESGKGKR